MGFFCHQTPIQDSISCCLGFTANKTFTILSKAFASTYKSRDFTFNHLALFSNSDSTMTISFTFLTPTSFGPSFISTLAHDFTVFALVHALSTLIPTHALTTPTYAFTTHLFALATSTLLAI